MPIDLLSKTFNRAIIATVFFLVVTLIASPVLAGDVYLNSRGDSFRLHVASMRELRYRTVVVQHYDYSCGAAAVATLLSYSYNRPTKEDEPFRQMILHGDKQKIQRLGFSMFDMKSFMERLGYEVSGFRLTLADLKNLRVPGIALVEINGYKHFIVVRAVNDRNVLFADPALGMQIMSKERFESIWDGVLLVIRNNLELARAGFNDEAFVEVRPRAPIGSGVQNAQGNLSVFSQTLFVRNMF